MNIFRTRTRRGAAILFSGVLVLGGLALTSEASAGQVVGGNPSCSSLGYTYEYKVESPSAKTYLVDHEFMNASLTVGTSYDQEGVEDPNKNNAITGYSTERTDGYVIIVKGGNGAIIYSPGEPPPLYAPANASGKWPTISHFDLCWNKPAPEPVFGALAVTKMVTGEGVPPGAKFEICIEGVTPVVQKICESFKAGETVTFDKLVPGTYKVTETNPGSAYTVTITPTDPVVVTAGKTATATVTNAYKAPPTPPPKEEVVPPTQEALPPTAPVTPTTPAAPVTPAAPAAPAEVSAQTALPTTGSEGGLAAIGALLVTTGLGLTLLSKRRGTQQA